MTSHETPRASDDEDPRGSATVVAFAMVFLIAAPVAYFLAAILT